MSLEKDRRVEEGVETTWKLYLRGGERKVVEVFKLAIDPEMKPEFQQMAIKTLLELGAASFSDSDRVWDSRLYG